MKNRAEFKAQTFLEWMEYIKSNFYTSAITADIANTKLEN